MLWWLSGVARARSSVHWSLIDSLWSSILNLFGVDWVMPRRVHDLLVSCRGQVGLGTIMEVWRLAPFILMWCLWRERNAQRLEDIKTSVVELRYNMFNTFFTQISAHHSLLISSFADFSNFCLFTWISAHGNLLILQLHIKIKLLDFCAISAGFWKMFWISC
jgi:hypothetical protein